MVKIFRIISILIFLIFYSCSSAVFSGNSGAVKQSPYLYYQKKAVSPNVQYTEEQAKADIAETEACSKIKDIPKTAIQYEGVPYKFGGNTPSGFDCSGLSSYVYAKNGIKIPRSASHQYKELKSVKIPKPGDLLFFKISNNNKVSHVGIYLGNNKMIHAPREGKPVSIVSIKNSYWKKTYAGARTVCP